MRAAMPKRGAAGLLSSAPARRWCLFFFCVKAISFLLVVRLARLRAHPRGHFELAGVAPAGVSFGNAAADGIATRSWFVGPFLPKATGRMFDGVEMKWSTHARGDKRAGPSASGAFSMAILVAGTHRIELPHTNTTLLMRQPGDFAIWAPGIMHSWTAIEESTVLTVRWPARKAAQTEALRHEKVEPPALEPAAPAAPV